MKTNWFFTEAEAVAPATAFGVSPTTLVELHGTGDAVLKVGDGRLLGIAAALPVKGHPGFRVLRAQYEADAGDPGGLVDMLVPRLQDTCLVIPETHASQLVRETGRKCSLTDLGYAKHPVADVLGLKRGNKAEHDSALTTTLFVITASQPPQTAQGRFRIVRSTS